MRHTLVQCALLLAVLLGLFAFACGEDGADPGQTSGTLATVLEGDGAVLAELFTRGLSATYRATYQTTSPEGEIGDVYVVSNKPPFARIDTIPLGSSEPASALIGEAGGATVSCSNEPAGWECVEIEPLGDSLVVAAGPVVVLSAVELAAFDVTASGDRAIAAQSVRCFRLRPRAGETGDEAEYCLNADGVPLYASAGFGVVEAITFSSGVADVAFVAPAEPRS